ncbi:flagellar basal body P-ring biosynthesis protein FlgA [Actibacterium mucosum KCTC 23349]|uniref:Flagella basal body P-ring formation protein FlgA n=1 Tax=Actibacterium mucosum KCTC 23349 TaxID=1454373 RepID=A0A037ZP67_9RHOB|nr:flagellar basal body P-ring formation chaperone FlgA [Actibacterium mucosum]KAJ57343.1 flagellar basal body P-ring biosynthesis protein FlgA [Actibacterium mucosum KCTC 23349]
MRILLVFLLLPTSILADTLVAARTIRAQSVIMPEDLSLVGHDVPGTLADPDAAIGMEARVMLYAGRPIRPGDLTPPALVDRNQIVTLWYVRGGLAISAEGRALGRAAMGDRLRVMNLASRSTVTGTVTETGEIIVGPPTR